jgi:methylase of polypeptide subunit release factors
MVKRVIGSDLNPRAVMLARLNAEVNGIGGVEFRQGSLYDPVPGERFDLIVSQPPFVPRPPGTPHRLFLHGGPRGDELAREIIAGAPAHLTETGRALVFSDWPLMEGECLAARIPNVQAKVTLHASTPIEPASYSASYGPELERYFAGQHIVGIRQCLTVLEHGVGTVEHLVLPHEWSRSV